jgi:hypothetical protein
MPIAIWYVLGAIAALVVGKKIVDAKAADVATAASAAGAPQLAAGTPQLAARKAPVTSAPPQTGPQALTREQKIAFFRVLPNLSVVEDMSRTTFDTGRLQPTSQMIAPSEKAAPALDLLYRASMMGHAILVGKNGSDTMVLVPAVGTAAGFAAPGSDWHVVLDPMEADAIAQASGIAIPDATKRILRFGSDSADNNLNPLFRGKGSASDSSGSGSIAGAALGPDGSGTFIPKPGNPFRRSVTSLVVNPKAARLSAFVLAVDDAHLDFTKVPGVLGENAQKAVDSGDAATLVAWADDLLSKGYSNAAQQLYGFARSAGWAPTDGDNAHYSLMTLDEVLASHHRIASTPSGWEDDIRARRDRAHTAPMPNDANALETARQAIAGAGYTVGAAELAAIVKALGGATLRTADVVVSA